MGLVGLDFELQFHGRFLADSGRSFLHLFCKWPVLFCKHPDWRLARAGVPDALCPPQVADLVLLLLFIERVAEFAGERNEFDLAAALPAGDTQRIGRLMADSHAAMRDDFEITCPPVDALVEIVKEVIGDAGGVRMTGGGFGDCVVSLVPGGLVDPVRAAVSERYPAATGLQGSIYVCHPSAGRGFAVDSSCDRRRKPISWHIGDLNESRQKYATDDVAQQVSRVAKILTGKVSIVHQPPSHVIQRNSKFRLLICIRVAMPRQSALN